MCQQVVIGTHDMLSAVGYVRCYLFFSRGRPKQRWVDKAWSDNSVRELTRLAIVLDLGDGEAKLCEAHHYMKCTGKVLR